MISDLSQPIKYLRQSWSQSPAFRLLLVIVLIYLLIHLMLQGVVLAEALPLDPDATDLVASDLHIYLEAASRLQNHQDLYLQEALDLIAVFQYAPAFALALIPLLWIPFGILAVIHTLLNIMSYLLLYLWWGRIFHRLGLDRANQMLAWTLPVWVVFAAFWGDMSYLNVYVITTLICTLLIEAILDERLGWSLLWVSIILQTKPYLAFPLALPLILGRPRFFFKLLILALIAYGGIVGITILLVGPAYGWQQHVEYVQFLANMTANFPWRDPDRGFLGYNHSILQIVFYLLGVTPVALRLATGIKILLLIPLVAVSLRHFLQPARCPGRDAPQLSLDLTFALYAGALIWLDIVWEMTLGIVIFTYLLATVEQRSTRGWIWAIFLPYALLDFWQIVSFLAFGPDVISPGSYILTDPSIYIPLVMIVILVFYALLIKRLWIMPLTFPKLTAWRFSRQQIGNAQRSTSFSIGKEE